ncbi:hypothetical protein PUNSTDRAFT_53195 [Punctularia strigosozonata HHB-11173 SS5]|uniref:uncharacterized protein n=1 Tax=Punctularia strigosozonata (strain HHB-11173) TaxID=741275 RepID=UPI00044169F0|nr:uncharacterized protein PUNSTDRAFT_53195 [Punctularia strigosozonata HHB-11173 SS5]EIN07841.1 hypothetical protein PUNSTDRAFT_53195 [Punctularia strigosozonata HHB-11173 SS5]
MDGGSVEKDTVLQRSSRSKEQYLPPKVPSRQKRQLDDEEYLPSLDLDANYPDARPKAKKQRRAVTQKAKKVTAKKATVPEWSKRFYCTECDVGASRRSDFRRHLESASHTGNPEGRVTCPRCGRKFARGDSWGRHFDDGYCFKITPKV